MSNSSSNKDLVNTEDMSYLVTDEIYQSLCSEEMRLHLRSIAEFKQMSVDDKRQALIEWYYRHHFPTAKSYRFLLSGQSPQDRSACVRRFEDFINSYAGEAAFEREEIRKFVEEKRNALIEAIKRASPKSLDEILGDPGYDRAYTGDGDTLETNTKLFSLMGYAAPALLYTLFNNPPDFLQRTETPNTLEYHISLNRKEIYCNGRLLNLTPQQHQIVEGIVNQKKRYWSSQELSKVLYGSSKPYTQKSDNLVSQAIARLNVHLKQQEVDSLLVYEKGVNRYKVPSTFIF